LNKKTGTGPAKVRRIDREKKVPACYAEAGEYSCYLDDTGVVDISLKVVFAHKKAR